MCNVYVSAADQAETVQRNIEVIEEIGNSRRSSCERVREGSYTRKTVEVTVQTVLDTVDWSMFTV